MGPISNFSRDHLKAVITHVQTTMMSTINANAAIFCTTGSWLKLLMAGASMTAYFAPMINANIHPIKFAKALINP
jgi:hypothetical protein